MNTPREGGQACSDVAGGSVAGDGLASDMAGGKGKPAGPTFPQKAEQKGLG